MKIAICSSMAFAKKMIEVKEGLEVLGYDVIIRDDVYDRAAGKISGEDKWRKLEIDPLKSDYKEIKDSDAVLVINIDKNGIATTLAEIP